MQKRQGLIITLTALLTGLTLVGGVAMYFVLRSTEKPAGLTAESKPTELPKSELPPSVTESIGDIAEAPVETTAPQEVPATPPAPDVARIIEQSAKAAESDRENNQENPPPAAANRNLGGVNWQKRDLRRRNLQGVQMGGSNLAGANLTGVDLSQTNLGGANLSGANLSGANLSQTDLRGANLEGADLRGTNLDAAYTDGANLKNAKLPN